MYTRDAQIPISNSQAYLYQLRSYRTPAVIVTELFSTHNNKDSKNNKLI